MSEWEAKPVGAYAALEARVRDLEAALRATERIAATHEGVDPEAYERITDVTRAVLAGETAGEPTR